MDFDSVFRIFLTNPKIRGRDSPHGVFDPWVRWYPGLDRIRSFRVVVVVVGVVVVVVLFLEKWFSEMGRKNTNLEKLVHDRISTQTEKLKLRSFILTRRGGAI